MIGYKIVQYTDGELRSLNLNTLLTDSVISNDIGMFISTNRQFVIDYYCGLTDSACVLLTVTFNVEDVLDPVDFNDSECSFRVSAFRIRNQEIINR